MMVLLTVKKKTLLLEKQVNFHSGYKSHLRTTTLAILLNLINSIKLTKLRQLTKKVKQLM